MNKENKTTINNYNNLMKNIHLEQKIEKLENIINGLLDEIVTISNNYNIDIHNGDSNYNYYKNEYINLEEEIIKWKYKKIYLNLY